MFHCEEDLDSSPALYIEAAPEFFVHDIIKDAREIFFTGDQDRQLQDVAASRVLGTNFIVAAGPNADSLENFFIDTVYNKSINQIVALGKVATANNLPYTDTDFYDYCLTEKNIACVRLHVSVQQVQGIVTRTEHNKRVYPHGIVQSTLTILASDRKPQTLNVTIFRLDNNDYIDLTPRNNFPESHEIQRAKQHLTAEKKEALWQLYKKSLTDSILVHSDSTTTDRTSHFILTLQILHHYSYIFSRDTPQDAVNEIHHLLKNMGTIQPHAKMQFTQAIANAHHLYTYALEKKYIKVGQPCAKIIPSIPVKKDTSSKYDPKIFGAPEKIDLKQTCPAVKPRTFRIP